LNLFQLRLFFRIRLALLVQRDALASHLHEPLRVWQMRLRLLLRELRLADFDTAELSNLNRIRTGSHNLGLNKTVIAAREIVEIDPFIKVKIFIEKYSQNVPVFTK